MNNDVELISRAPYIVIQAIKNREVEGYRGIPFQIDYPAALIS